MNEKKKLVHESFKSYINDSPKNNGEKNGSVQEIKPKLLNGELVVGAAHSVVMLTPLSERERGRFGSLFVTNYKLSFVPLETTPSDDYCQRNYLLGTYDVPRTGVDAVWLTDGGPVRRRQLHPNKDMPRKVKGLQVVCKNMKVLTFSFVNSPLDNGRKVAISLMHYAFPKRHDLLFAYEYKEYYHPTLPSDLNMFQRPTDWVRELERCKCNHWRITCINGTSDAFMLTAGETLIVPNSVLDYNLMETARHFRSGRVPIWVWGRAEGAALLRSGELLQTDHSASTESVLLEQVRRSHPKLTPPYVIYLCGNPLAGNTGANALPPLPALQASYRKLMELCTPTTLEAFWVQDSQYYSVVEQARWARHVAAALACAADAAAHLADNVTTVLQEGDGVDYCAVVSCLTQLLLDPHCRTLAGFQSLVQKEWVALGHPFADRLGLPPGVPKEGKEPSPTTAAPVFLLFLDCVWQLTQQFPSRFQFTDVYLVTLWDCVHNHLFDTFLFNCPKDRELAVKRNFIERPVWDWGEQFSDGDRALFENPLYTCLVGRANSQRLSQTSTSSSPSRLDRLEPCCSVAAVELWSTCYERWLAPLDVPHAGPVQLHVHHARTLAERWLAPLDVPHAGPVQLHVHHARTLAEIKQLNDKLSSLSIMSNRQSNGDDSQEPPSVPVVSRFYPFSVCRGEHPTLDAMQVSLIDPSQLLDSQSLLNAPD